MIGIVELIAVESLVNVTLLRGLFKAHQRADIQESLLVWRRGGKPTPIADGVMKKMAGVLTFKQQRKANAIITGLREIINRKAFEYAIAGILNPNSKLRRRMPLLQKVGKRLQSKRISI